MTWTFRDYVDRRGRNAIKEWLGTVPSEVKVKLNARLQHLRDEKVLMDTRFTEKLKGQGAEGLMEIKFEVGNVQYRPLAFYGPNPGEITIVFPAEERNDRFVPPGAVGTAQRRRHEVIADPEGKSCSHDYS